MWLIILTPTVQRSNPSTFPSPSLRVPHVNKILWASTACAEQDYRRYRSWVREQRVATPGSSSQKCVWHIYIYTGWWFEPLWKIWKSIGMIILNIWENKKWCFKPPTSIQYMKVFWLQTCMYKVDLDTTGRTKVDWYTSRPWIPNQPFYS